MRLLHAESKEANTVAALALLLVSVACQTTTPPPIPTTPTTPTPTTTLAPPVGTTRVTVVNAANDAFQRGDFTTASALYERVLNTPPTGEPREVSAAIDDFARFRGMISLLQQGREDEAKAQLDALKSADAGTPFARLASQFWDQYGMTGNVRGACAQVQPQIASQAGPTLSALQTIGVNVDAQTLCGVPAS